MAEPQHTIADPTPKAPPTASEPDAGQSATVLSSVELTSRAEGQDFPTIPGFHIVDEIGRGGMGVVYRARDTSIHRDVAIKVLQEEHDAESRSSTRFIEEAQITGQLQHPGVPAVHQVGKLADGRPYLAMKLIKGQTLDALLKNRNASTNWLSIFEAICQAVGYAHAHRVIHRDLKPSNIMVGNFGEVQVMDWGLAKVLSNTPTKPDPDQEPDFYSTEIRSPRDSDTRFGSVLGTAAYMSPEQASGESDRVDQRSDVFSLGAILCVILTGKPPYVAKDMKALLRSAVRCQTVEAFTRLDACGAEPQVIALAKHCLTDEPSQRPMDANVLALEMSRLRASAEVRAREAELQRAKAEVKTAEQRKRRRIQLALVASVFALLVAVGGGLWWLDRQERNRESERSIEAANQRQRDAEREVEAANQRQRETERKAEVDYQLRAIALSLNQAEAGLKKENSSLDEIDSALTQAQHHLTICAHEDALVRFEGLKEDLQMLRRLREIDERMWLLSNDRKNADEKYGVEHYPKAFQDYGFDLMGQPVANLAAQVGRSPIVNHLKTAIDSWWRVTGDGKLLEVINVLDPDPDRSVLRSAYARNDVVQIRAIVAKLEGRNLPPAFAQLVGSQLSTPQADAVRILKAAQAAHPTHFGLAFITAIRIDEKEPAERVAFYRVALAIRPRNLLCLNNLGLAYQQSKDTDLAIAVLKEALELDPKLALAHNNIGLALGDKKQFAAAVASFKEVIRLDPVNASAQINLGNTLRDMKDLKGAIAACEEGIRLAPDNPRGYVNLGNALLDQGDLAGAIAKYKQAIRIDRDYALAHTNLGWAYYLAKDLDAALAAGMEAIRLDSKFVLAHNNLGVIHLARKNPDLAIASFQRAIELDPKLTMARSNLGQALNEKKEYREAIAIFKEALQIDPNLAMTHNNYGNALIKTGETDAAIAEYREAIRLDANDATTHYNLGSALSIKRDLKGATDSYREAVRLNPKFADAYTNLGVALGESKEFDAAASAFENSIRIDPKASQPYLGLSYMLHLSDKPRKALEVLREAAKENPEWMTDISTAYRYQATCCAALTGTGHGNDKLDESEWPKFRAMAREWLVEELAAWRKTLTDPKVKSLVYEKLTHWLGDDDLAGVRDKTYLMKLPADEAAAWERLWDDVRKLREETAPTELLPLPKEKI